MLLGIFGDAHQTDRALELNEGDAVILYTDGLLDERQSMPELRLLSIISDCTGHDADAIAERLMATATRADVVYDDRAVLVLRLAEDEPEEPESLITWRSTS